MAMTLQSLKDQAAMNVHRASAPVAGE